jgi:hypothetical protein
MGGRWRNEPDVPARIAKDLVAQLAGRQQARVTRAQLRWLGIGTSTISDWIAGHYLHPRLPGVYAVGAAARTDESALFEAVLYAGPGAMLSHATAVHRRGLIDDAPARIHVSTPRRRASLPGICVHSRRAIKRTLHDGIPVTTVAQSMLDLAAVSEHDPVAVRVARPPRLPPRTRRPRTQPGLRLRVFRQPFAQMGGRELRPTVRAHPQSIRERLDCGL